MSLQDNTNYTLYFLQTLRACSLTEETCIDPDGTGVGGGTYFIIPQAEKGTYRNTHRPPFTSAEYRLGNLEHAPRQ